MNRIEVQLRPTLDEANFPEDLTADEIAAILKVEELTLDEIVAILKEIEDEKDVDNSNDRSSGPRGRGRRHSPLLPRQFIGGLE
jgi:hypothetical protein